MTAIDRDWKDPEDDGDGVAASLHELITSRRAQFALLLYLLFPLFAGFISAMQGSGRTSGWPLGFRIAYYLPLALVVMWTSGIACHLLKRPARALRIPLWALLIAGVLVAGEFIKLYVGLVVPIFDELLPPNATGGRVVKFTLMGNVQAALPTILTWLCLNLLAWKVFGITRFGYVAPPSMVSSKWSRIPHDSSVESHIPNFLHRAKLASIDAVEAIEAQQHYIKLHSANGARTILYRFGYAINELAGDEGVRVHRSWWVNNDHVVGLIRDGDRLSIKLTSGLMVPVSRTYSLQAKQHFG